jgi:DNA gyrase/topoisomerase IV subunit A
MNDDKKELKLRLKEKFGLEDIQVKKLLSMRLDMFTEHDYLMDLEEQKNNHKGWEPKQMVQYYEKKIREAKKQTDEYKTYIMISENYQDMIGILEQNPDFTSYAGIMREKYGFDGSQTRLVKLITVADIVSKEKYIEKIEKLEKDIARYEEYIKEQKGMVELNGKCRGVKA